MITVTDRRCRACHTASLIRIDDTATVCPACDLVDEWPMCQPAMPVVSRRRRAVEFILIVAASWIIPIAVAGAVIRWWPW